MTTKAEKRKRTMLLHRIVRIVVQILFFVLAPGAWASAFNGIKYICTQVGASQTLQFGGFVFMLVGLLAYTIVLGRFFCGYACAFGAVGDWLYVIFTPVRKLLKIPQNVPQRLASVLRYLKFVVLIAICVLCFTASWDKVSSYSPWTCFSSLISLSWGEVTVGALVVLIVILLMQALFERSFCRFLCPMGAVFSLMPVLPFSCFSRKVNRCGKKWCGLCQKNCPVGIYPDSHSASQGECIGCGRCADACPLANVALAQVGKEKKSKILWKGSGIPTVLVKVVLLFVLLWVCGSVRFVPAISDVFSWWPF